MSGVRPAGFWRRGWALLLDVLLLAVVLWVLRIVAAHVLEASLQRAVLDAAGRTYARYAAWHALARDLLGLAVPFLYFALLEGLFGATLGKLVLGVRVRTTAGRPAGLLRAFLRTALKPLSLGCCAVGVLLVAWSSHKRAPHDWLAGTVVLPARAGGATPS